MDKWGLGLREPNHYMRRPVRVSSSPVSLSTVSSVVGLTLELKFTIRVMNGPQNNIYLLNTYCVPGTDQGSWKIIVWKSKILVREGFKSLKREIIRTIENNSHGDIPGGPMAKNPPSNARDMGLIPGWGRFTCLRATKPLYHNYWACAQELGSPNYWARLLQLLKLACPRARAQQEKPPQWESRVLQPESSPHSLQLEKSPRSN